MWNAFAGYTDVYGRLPSAQQVRRVRLYLFAQNQYEAEQYKQQQRELEELKRKNAAAADSPAPGGLDSGGGTAISSGRSTSIRPPAHQQ